MGKLYNIQVLRALAALIVALGHLSIPLPSLIKVDGGLLSHGASGVDIFFVISGFIMVYTTDNRQQSPIQFLRSRATRIIPLYWLITIFIFLTAIILPNIFPQVGTNLKNLIFSLSFLPQGKSPIVYVGWSLNYEVLFYILFSIGLAIGGSWRIAFPLLFIISSSALSFATSGGPWWTFLTDPISLEFCAGMLLGYTWTRVIIDWRIAAAAMTIAMIAIFVGPYPLDGDPRIVRVLAYLIHRGG